MCVMFGTNSIVVVGKTHATHNASVCVSAVPSKSTLERQCVCDYGIYKLVCKPTSTLARVLSTITTADASGVHCRSTHRSMYLCGAVVSNRFDAS